MSEFKMLHASTTIDNNKMFAQLGSSVIYKNKKNLFAFNFNL